MLITLIELTVLPVIVYVTLFGLLGGGFPKPGGVTLFFRVGLVGALVSAGLFVAEQRFSLGHGLLGEALVNTYRGLAAGAGLLLLMATFGTVLKRQR